MNNHKDILKLVACLVMTGNALIASAVPLTPQQVIYRCYKQLAQTKPSVGNTLVNSVFRGQKKPIEACLELLDKAQLVADGNSVVADSADADSRAVLFTLHRLHASWFSNKGFVAGVGTREKSLYDNSSPALYYSKALFTPNFSFKNIFLVNTLYAPIRTQVQPGNIQSIIGPHELAPMGALLGIKEAPAISVSTNVGTPPPVLPLNYNLGSGVIGSAPYLLQNFTISSGTTPMVDGGVIMHRSWSKNVFRDFMCRELPVLRTEDVTQYLATSSNIPFRQSVPCLRCHTTMDPMAASVRNITYNFFANGRGASPQYLGTFPAPTEPSEGDWPAVSDNKFMLRPTLGKLTFRNYRGEYVSRALTGLQDIGPVLTEQDDLYVCTAKRYYQYFMGVDMPFSDPEGRDPEASLTPAQKQHRANILTLASSLKNHQSLRRLLQEIFNLPEYSLSDFGRN